jgi:hypothetical protein
MPAPATTRVALALGLVGRLGEELLAQLLSATRLQAVYVGVRQSVGSATARFRPWQVGNGVVAADEAWLCLTGDETFVPQASPVLRWTPAQIVEGAQLARACGAQRLAVVAPLAALLQMSATGVLLEAGAELRLREVGFAQLIVVRPTAAELSAAHGPWPQRLLRTVARTVAGIMLPGYTQLLSARVAAAAIVAAVDAAPAGVSLYGARELVQIVEERLPAIAPKTRRWRRR